MTSEKKYWKCLQRRMNLFNCLCICTQYTFFWVFNKHPLYAENAYVCDPYLHASTVFHFWTCWLFKKKYFLCCRVQRDEGSESMSRKKKIQNWTFGFEAWMKDINVVHFLIINVIDLDDINFDDIKIFN